VIAPQAPLFGHHLAGRHPARAASLAHALPLTYANEALRGVMIRGDALSDLVMGGGILLGFAKLMALLASISLRRDLDAPPPRYPLR
jgi:ABC-2 type transport system permease protein